jgi:hypothetical protein
MRSFVLRIIVIECCSAGGFPLEEASEHCFLSIKVLFWCCGFIYCVVPLLFSAIFMFSAIIIDLVPYIYHNQDLFPSPLPFLSLAYRGIVFHYSIFHLISP